MCDSRDSHAELNEPRRLQAHWSRLHRAVVVHLGPVQGDCGNQPWRGRSRHPFHFLDCWTTSFAFTDGDGSVRVSTTVCAYSEVVVNVALQLAPQPLSGTNETYAANKNAARVSFMCVMFSVCCCLFVWFRELVTLKINTLPVCKHT